MESNVAIIWQSYKQGDDQYYRDRLISNYKPFLKGIVSSVYSKLPREVDIMDIESYAYVGLIDAINKFNPKRNIKFETYASYRIKGAIVDGMRKQDWLSRTLRTQNNAIEEEESGKEKFSMFSIDDPNFYDKKREENADSAGNIFDLYASKTSDFVDKVENKMLLKEILKNLSPQGKKIVYQYYFKGKNFKEIGKLLGITESRVSQINKSIILSLRKEMKKSL